MKKIISIMLVMLLLFNFIFCNGAYAKEAEGTPSRAEEALKGESASQSNTATAEIIEEGTVSRVQNSSEKVVTSALSYGASIVGVVTGILARIINVIVLQIDVILAQLTYAEESVNGESKTLYWLTIERMVFNRVPLFNINYFDTNTEYVVGAGDSKAITVTADPSNNIVKGAIANVFYISRTIALAIGLLVLIYIGIRMAISTVALEQAKYKKMLISWVESIILIFFMLYIMSFTIRFGELLTSAFYNLEQQVISLVSDPEETSSNTKATFEETIRSQTLNYTFSLSGLKLTFWSIVYWLLLLMEFKFFWTYIKRFLMVGFLIAISPLITITYSIDKAGDGRAQAFSIWMKEFITNVLIQPLHALIYIIFVLTANNIAEEAPIIAVAFFLAMGTVEKMVKVIFNVSASTLKGLNEINPLRRGR